MLLLLLTVLVTTCLARHKPWTHKNPRFIGGHFYPDSPIDFSTKQFVSINEEDFYENLFLNFDFPQLGFADQVFVFNTTLTDFYVNVFDCFCSGDSFNVFLDGLLIGSSPGLDSIYAADCEFYSSDSNDCFISGSYYHFWSFFRKDVYTNAGYHEILIQTKESFYNGGSGFLKVGAGSEGKK